VINTGGGDSDNVKMKKKAAKQRIYEGHVNRVGSSKKFQRPKRQPD
jgi:hypothetical protein